MGSYSDPLGSIPALSRRNGEAFKTFRIHCLCLPLGFLSDSTWKLPRSLLSKGVYVLLTFNKR